MQRPLIQSPRHQVHGSENPYVRVWDRERQRHIVKTTGVRIAIKARHNDVTVADEPKRLILTVRNGKTDFRAANLT